MPKENTFHHSDRRAMGPSFTKFGTRMCLGIVLVDLEVLKACNGALKETREKQTPSKLRRTVFTALNMEGHIETNLFLKP